MAAYAVLVPDLVAIGVQPGGRAVQHVQCTGIADGTDTLSRDADDQIGFRAVVEPAPGERSPEAIPRL